MEFAVDEVTGFDFKAGQFVSMVAPDSAGKQQTRAYSIASAPRANELDFCVNRVEGGFFSNYLCDLKIGETVQFHGPHGLFVLRNPLTDGIFIATGTGIAPMRSFVQKLFPDQSPDGCEGREIWLVYGTRYETEIYYEDYFERVAAKHSNFHYLKTLSRAENGWKGNRGYVQDLVAGIAEEHTRRHAHEPPLPINPDGFRAYAYICGLNDMVAANRDRLTGLGWDKKQVVFERYD